MADSDITIVGLSVSPGVNQNVLQWAVNDPNVDGLPYLRFDHAEVYASQSSNMSGAVRLDDDNAFTAFAHTPIGRGETWYYQVLAVNRAEQSGELCEAVSGREISGDVSFIAHPDGVHDGDGGYWKLPNGLIFQWGYREGVASGLSGIITLPIPFPNGCLNVVASFGNAGTYDRTLACYGFEDDPSVFYMTVADSAGDYQPQGIYFFAIGY